MNVKELRDMTIVIPTKNRPQYVERILTYYLDLNFIGNIIIIDSSDEETAEYIKKYVNNINKVNFTYSFSEGLPTTVIRDNVNLIKTKYVSFLGDDDYIIPTGILRSIKYLKNNPDIVACRGEALKIRDSNLSSDSISRYWNFFNRLEDSSGDRVIKHFSDYHTPFFQVCRSEMFIKAYSSAPSMSEIEAGYDRLIGDELIVAALMLAYGKFASIEGLHLVRTNSNEDIELRESWLYDENVIGKEMAIRDLRKKTATAVSEQDAIPFEDAEKIAISILDKPILTQKYNSTINESFKGFLKPILQFLNLFELCLTLRSNFYITKRKVFTLIFVSKNKRIGLKNLLNPDNFYHEEFMPVYRSITNYNLKKNKSNLVDI